MAPSVAISSQTLTNDTGTTGDRITYSGGKLSVPNNPIIPYVEGDGTGADIWRASVRVFDAAVEKAFSGELKEFTLPLAPSGSAFQMAVWTELTKIPYGSTVSYGDIALALGKRLVASRAVGLANGSNPISVIVPCHRVIGSDGSLTGYGGGLERKELLLRLEVDLVIRSGHHPDSLRNALVHLRHAIRQAKLLRLERGTKIFQRK